MSRALITINGNSDRDRAVKWIGQARPGTRVEFKEAKRSNEQNDRMWAMLTDVATQVPWHGISLTPDDWKFIFLDALKREVRAVPNIDGTGFVNIGRSTSDLAKAEMSDLIELIAAFGAEKNVVFHDQDSSQPRSPAPSTETDKPASESDASGAGTNSESSVVAEPAADDEGGGDSVSESTALSPSTLKADWREIYLKAMSRVNDRPKSLPNRHTEALGLIGGKANDAEQKWMKAAYNLTKFRMENGGSLKITVGDIEHEINP